MTPMRRQQLDEMQVALLPTRCRGVVAHTQELVVARDPDDRSKRSRSRPQRPLDPVGAARDVARDHQPVGTDAPA